MGSMRAALVEVADTVEALSLAKLENRTLGQAERTLRMAGRRFEARQAIGLQWDARDRIEMLRCRLPERLATRLFGG